MWPIHDQTMAGEKGGIAHLGQRVVALYVKIWNFLALTNLLSRGTKLLRKLGKRVLVFASNDRLSVDLLTAFDHHIFEIL